MLLFCEQNTLRPHGLSIDYFSVIYGLLAVGWSMVEIMDDLLFRASRPARFGNLIAQQTHVGSWSTL
jgi:hypothetical protein